MIIKKKLGVLIGRFKLSKLADYLRLKRSSDHLNSIQKFRIVLKPILLYYIH